MQEFELKFGKAHIFYPEATPERCTAALLLDIDPVHLVREQHGPQAQYVNDRPYVASSLMSVALAHVYRSALNGQSNERPVLAATAIPFTARLAVVQCRGGESILRRLFEPLGYAVAAQAYPLDEQYPDWGQSNYFTLELTATIRLQDLLTHLYVLLPVLDAEKHYWIGPDEVEKLLRRGEGWLAQHPERDLIARRYLKVQRLVRAALLQLAEEDIPDPDAVEEAHAQEEAAIEQGLSLHQQRLGAVLAVIKNAGAQRVLDLSCGEGRLLELLLAEKSFTQIVGMDVSQRVLELAAKRLRLEQLSPVQRERVQLIHGALTYRNRRLAGYDAAAVVEVIEHLDAPRLATFERVLFEFAWPKMVVYGHTPVPEPEWLNRTINIDTGCVLGGRLTALRYPERELVSVPALRTYAELARPFLAPEPQAPLTAQQQHDDLLDIEGVLGKRFVSTRLHHNVTIREENAAAALEVMSRFAANPKWLVYLPPTMSPVETTQQPGLLEHPSEAFAYYRHEGVSQVVCEEKHMGSRAVVIVCRDEEVARERFGVMGEGIGICYTRTGRRFFNDPALETEFLARVRSAVDASGLWEDLKSDWLCHDPLFMATPYQVIDLTEPASQAVGVAWWEALTGRGGEGMVVKPLSFVARGRRGLIQPAVKCRGRDYLRIIYGPEYAAPEHLARLRSRSLARKRSLALREFALGVEALERFVQREPLYRVHECVFGILALESEPVDPRL